MSSVPTTSLRLEMQGQGDNPNDWAPRLNNVIAMLDDAIAGFAQVNVAANITLTSNVYTSDQARKMVLRLTGPGGFTITVPTAPKMYFIDCQTVADCLIKTAGGTATTIVKGTKRVAYCDGTNMVTDTSVTSSAVATAFTPYGNLASTNVQGALQELDDEKAPKAGPIFTGSVTVAPQAVGAGSVALVGGLDGRSGYLQFTNASGLRVGVVGYVSATDIELFAENGRTFNFLGGTPRVGGKAITVQDTTHYATGFGNAGRQNLIYSDPGTNNFILRVGANTAGSPFRYFGFLDDGRLTVPASVEAAALSTQRGNAAGAVSINAREASSGTDWVAYSLGGLLRFFGASADQFRVQADGDIWTRMHGWLSVALNYRLPYDRPVAGGGITIAGGSNYENAEPEINLLNGGRIQYRLRTANDGYLRISNKDSGEEYFAFGPGGDILRAGAGHGDLDAQIESRAAAWAATRQAPISVIDTVGSGDDVTRRVYFNGVWQISGTAVVTTNTNGDGSVAFPWAQASCETVVPVNGDGGTTEAMNIDVISKNGSGFTFRARNPGNIGARTIRVNYIATGAL